MKKILFVFTLAVSLIATSCKKEEESAKVQPYKKELTAAQLDQRRIAFAKVLAKALVNENVRKLLKNEAAKQFDMDYDVLFQIVKDKEVASGISFSEYLASLSNDETEFFELTESLPLLTILVPELQAFSVNKWDLNTQIPIVAVVNSNHDEKSKTELVSFDHNGNQFKLPSNIEPKVPVIVVKENERVIAINPNSRIIPVEKGRYILRNKEHSLYYSYDAFDPQKNKTDKNARITSPASLTQKLKQAYSLNAVSQRDYVYYNILTNTDRGNLNTNYAEYITGFYFVNQTNLNFANDDPTSDWADGAMEFYVDILFFNGKTALSNSHKVFSIAKSNLINSDGSVKVYTGAPFPLHIATWDVQSMGDTWKIVAEEIDPASTYTTTFQVGSKFGTNFSLKADGTVEKIGIGITGGNSTEDSRSLTFQYQTTQANDPLGSDVLTFINKVILSHSSTFGSTTSYQVYDINTGVVRMTIEPRLIQ